MTDIDLSKYETDDWGKDNDSKKPFEFTVPSGKTVLVRRLDMTDILRLGMIEDLDFMAKALVTDDKKPADKTGPDEDTSVILKAIGNAQNFSKMENMINAIVVHGVVAPKLYAPPLLDAARPAGLRYVDSVDFTDRVAIFSVVFDSEGLSTFREESQPSVANLPDGDSVPLPAE